MDGVTIKSIGMLVGGAVSSLLLALFDLSFPAFLSGLVGAYLGELFRGESTFVRAGLTAAVASILTAWIGSVVVTMYPNFHAPSVLGLCGFGLAYFRDSIINALKDFIKTKGKGDRYGGYDDFGGYE